MFRVPEPASRGMTRSVFNAALAEVFPHGFGETLVSDQVLVEFGVTPAAALEAGVDPLEVWQALLRATGKDTEENLWWHRRNLKQNRQF